MEKLPYCSIKLRLQKLTKLLTKWKKWMGTSKNLHFRTHEGPAVPERRPTATQETKLGAGPEFQVERGPNSQRVHRR